MAHAPYDAVTGYVPRRAPPLPLETDLPAHLAFGHSSVASGGSRVAGFSAGPLKLSVLKLCLRYHGLELDQLKLSNAHRRPRNLRSSFSHSRRSEAALGQVAARLRRSARRSDRSRASAALLGFSSSPKGSGARGTSLLTAGP